MTEPEDEFRKRQERFFFLVGYAITRWAYVDRSLFDFCEFALNTTERKTAILFYRTPSIGDHLTLTNALMRDAQLETRHSKHWEQIVGAIETLLPFRNDLAHNPPVQTGFMAIAMDKDNPLKTHATEHKQWWEIRTEPKKLLHKPKNKKPREIKATSDQILEHIKMVETLEQAISALSWEVLGRPKGLGPTVPAPIFPPEMDQY
jgi:hypothetical protein